MQGRETGYTKGQAKGRAEGVLAVLRARGIDTAGLVKDPGLLAGYPLDASMAAALACTGEADFRRRLREAPPAGDDGDDA